MPKKLDYKHVKAFIEEKSNGEAKLISTSYVNSTTPLLIKCKCGNEFHKSFDKCKNGFFMCSSCLNQFRSKKYSLTMEQIINEISKEDCEYINGEYINNTSKLLIKCKCGELFFKDFNHFKRQPRCPKCGNQKLKDSKKKYDFEAVSQIFMEKGFKLLETKYIGCQTPMKCMCSNKHIQYKKLTDLKNQKHGCLICSIKNNSGENHWNYKGGKNELFDTLRKDLKNWKFSVLCDRNFKCELSNNKSNLEVHHLKNFIDIITETLQELSLPLYRKCCQYSDKELDNIRQLFIKKHTLKVGVVLTKKLHKEFHTLYGIHNNTIEQFEEFKRKYKTN